MSGGHPTAVHPLTDERIPHTPPLPADRPAGPTSPFLAALAEAGRTHPHSRKLLIGPDINYGRELLFALARHTGGWIGWEAANLRGIAEELAFTALGEADRRTGTDVEIGALVSQALDLAIAGRAVSERFGGLAVGLGFRRAVRDAVLELRTAGVPAGQVRAATMPGAPAHDLAAVLERYEELLAASELVDPAGIFALALDRFDVEAPLVLDARLFVSPALVARGLAGRLHERLLAYGATMLPDVPVSGVDALADGEAVTCDLFVAATPADEIREALRRALDEGLPWDEVEIVATDEDTYGIALDAVCQQLGLAATALQGVPLARTRIGRALERWLSWLSEGLPADTLREALEAGELAAPGSTQASPGLARTLRPLQIGWGRARYEDALRRLRDGSALARTRQRDDEGEEAFAERRAARVRAIESLARLLEQLLRITPAVPERGGDDIIASSCHTLARATLGYLELVPTHGAAEGSTMDRVRGRLQQLADVPSPEVSFARAMAELRDGIADLRAWPGMTSERKPWSAGGGMVHLTGLVHAGTTGRKRTFVVGLDADRAVGSRIQDPILTDAVRLAIGAQLLPTTAMRRQEKAGVIARAIGGLRGRATLSHAIAGAADGREAGPAPVLLHALRVLDRSPGLTYKQLRERLGAPACAAPGRAGQALDARDAWLAALAGGPVLLDGEEAVRSAFPMLDEGLVAQAIRAGDQLTGHHGMVPAAAGLLDPRRAGARPVSPSSLELLAACPLAWFHKYGLGLRPPTDPTYDPEAWLDALERGELLHEIYERFTRAYEGRQREIAANDASARMHALADEVLARWRAEVPPPSEAVYASEAAELRQAALAFLTLERQALARPDAGEWMRVELPFGGEQPVAYELAPGMLVPVQGRIDRVDRLPNGQLVVVDYKTGSPNFYRPTPKMGPFRGGRRLQAAIYAAAAEALLHAEVARFEYRFPTPRGQNEVVRYGRDAILSARTLVAVLLEHAERGEFVTTSDPRDCKYCDSRPICRVADGTFNSVVSPRAEWAETNAGRHDAYRGMLARRAPA